MLLNLGGTSNLPQSILYEALRPVQSLTDSTSRMATMAQLGSDAPSMELDGDQPDQRFTDMSTSEVSTWLARKGFSTEIQEAFAGKPYMYI